jgi:hypothetical protein
MAFVSPGTVQVALQQYIRLMSTGSDNFQGQREDGLTTHFSISGEIHYRRASLIKPSRCLPESALRKPREECLQGVTLPVQFSFLTGSAFFMSR